MYLLDDLRAMQFFLEHRIKPKFVSSTYYYFRTIVAASAAAALIHFAKWLSLLFLSFFYFNLVHRVPLPSLSLALIFKDQVFLARIFLIRISLSNNSNNMFVKFAQRFEFIKYLWNDCCCCFYSLHRVRFAARVLSLDVCFTVYLIS